MASETKVDIREERTITTTSTTTTTTITSEYSNLSPSFIYKRMMELKEEYKRYQIELSLISHEVDDHSKKGSSNNERGSSSSYANGAKKNKQKSKMDPETSELITNLLQILDELGGSAHIETIIENMRSRYLENRRARDGMPLDSRKAVTSILAPKITQYCYNNRPLFIRDASVEGVWMLAPCDPLDSDMENDEEDFNFVNSHTSNHHSHNDHFDDGIHSEWYPYYLDDEDRPESQASVISQKITASGGSAHYEDICSHVIRYWQRPLRYMEMSEEEIKDSVRITLNTDPKFWQDNVRTDCYTLAKSGANSTEKRKRISNNADNDEVESSYHSKKRASESGATERKNKKQAVENSHNSPMTPPVYSNYNDKDKHITSPNYSNAFNSNGQNKRGTAKSKSTNSNGANHTNGTQNRANSPPPGYRCACGATEPGRGKGPTAKWKKGTVKGEFLCHSCSTQKKHACPICGKVYRKNDPSDEDNPWIRCDDCHRWVMSKCDGITDLSIYDDDNPNHLHYSCPHCRRERAERERENRESKSDENYEKDNDSSTVVTDNEDDADVNNRYSTSKRGRGRRGKNVNDENSRNGKDVEENNSPIDVDDEIKGKKGANMKKGKKNKRGFTNNTATRGGKRKNLGSRKRNDDEYDEEENQNEEEDEENEDDDEVQSNVTVTSKLHKTRAHAQSQSQAKLDIVEQEIFQEWNEYLQAQHPQEQELLSLTLQQRLADFKAHLLASQQAQIKSNYQEYTNQLSQAEKEKSTRVKHQDAQLVQQLRNYYKETKDRLDQDRKRVWEGDDL